ncbi:MAG: GcrA cell cycle regulator, partial [Alphaproteobacteria bacterium]
MSAELVLLWRDGLTASQIAAELGVTKGAVIGRVHRMGLPARKPGGKKGMHGGWRKKKHTRAARAVARPEGREAARTEGRVATARPSIPSPLSPDPCGLMELSDTRCRWPVGEPGDAAFHFCGAG